MLRNFGMMILAALLFACVAPAFAEKPVEVDCSRLAFYPKRWRQAGVSFNMLAWQGEHITLITKLGEYDEKKMAAFVRVLDQGWKTQHDLVGTSPRMFRQVNGKPTIVALPKTNLSCGYGCGYVGATGIEVAGFYNKDWPQFLAKPDAFAHYYFYEMGRNYFVFGDRHSLFTTGYAVFMRYVCMDRIGCKDGDAKTRNTIEACEQIYADSKIKFIDAFTNLSADEKGNRLRDKYGRAISPSDQPVMYATAMLKLRKDYGGDAWVKKFMHALRECKAYRATDARSAIPQLFNWLVCASKAAGKDLSPVFADRWRMPLTEKQRAIMKDTDWTEAKLSVSDKVDALMAGN